MPLFFQREETACCQPANAYILSILHLGDRQKTPGHDAQKEGPKDRGRPGGKRDTD